METFETAVAAFRSGDSSGCISLLSHHVGPEALALRARCLIREGRSANALALLDELDTRSLGHRTAAELLIVKARAAFAASDPAIFDKAMLEAKARAYGVGSVELAAELRYYEALHAWTMGAFEDARQSAELALMAHSDIPAWLRESVPSYPFTLGYWRARQYELLGMIAGSQFDFQRQSTLLVNAFDEYDRADCADAFVEAGMLANLAVLVRDLQESKLADYVRARYLCMAWNPALAKFRFRVIESLGWCNALSGNHLGGLRDFRASSEIAPTKALKITAILDRAVLAAELGESFFAAEELGYASELAAEMNWETGDGQDRVVLLMLTRALAPHDVARARVLLDRYLELKMPVSALLVQAHDRRVRGDECMATAAVVRAEGQRDRATMLFREAFEIWTEVGYAWRAACAALEIYTLTGEREYLDVVAREAAVRPHSWIARRYAALAPELATV